MQLKFRMPYRGKAKSIYYTYASQRCGLLIVIQERADFCWTVPMTEVVNPSTARIISLLTPIQ